MSLRFEWVVFFSTLAALLLFFVIDAKQDEAARTQDTITGAMIQDNVVTSNVKYALSRDADAGSLAFKVKTRKGKVQLIGRIDTEAQIDRVIALTRGVAGVRSITIRVTPAVAGGLIASRTETGSVRNAIAGRESLLPDRHVAQRSADTLLGGFVDDQIQGAHVTEIAFGFDPGLVVATDITHGR